MSISYKKISKMIDDEVAEITSDSDQRVSLIRLAEKIFMIESSVDGRSVQSKREAIKGEIIQQSADIKGS
jgi:hypothetical protein